MCKCLDNYILSVDGCVPNPELEGCESGCTCAPGCLGCLDSHEESCLICDNSIAFLYLDIIDEENQTGLCTCPETTYWDGSAC